MILKLTENKYDASRRIWILNKDYTYNGIKIPKGFATDLASVPTLLWWYCSPSEIAEAAILHDYLYHTRMYSRKKCDQILYECVKKTTRKSKAYMIYLAVRLGGGASYGKERK